MFALHSKDDDDDLFEGMFEDGHWEWSEKDRKIEFVPNGTKSEDSSDYYKPAYGGSVPFRDDIEMIEQQRFRKRYQRKVAPGQKECVTLQDVKDVALFTAPLSVMTISVINILHLPITERFIRAVVLYCQYYLQVTDEMMKRALELRYKLPSLNSLAIEKQFHDNLEDLRLLVAKEYCTFLIAGNGLKSFHHMGPKKKLRSLSKKDAHIFESIIRITIQIVWLALGRRCFREIDLEVNRIFKSDSYNTTEHRLKARDYLSMSCRERRVLLGKCVRIDKKLDARSPLLHQVDCNRYVDYRMFGVGLLEFPRMTPRLCFFERALTAPEESFQDFKMSLGIIGMPRCKFDTMLREIMYSQTSDTGPGSSLHSRSSSVRRRSSRLSQKTKSNLGEKLYKDIHLPEKGEESEWIPEHFPHQPRAQRPCSLEQRQRWLNRLAIVKSRIRRASRSK